MSAGRRGSERLDEHPQTPPLCVFCQETPLVRRDSAMTKIGKYNFGSFVRHSTREWSSECWAKDAAQMVSPHCRRSDAGFCQSRSKKGQCPGAKLDTWFDLGAHPGACAFQIADACQGALAAGQPFRSFGIFRITVWRFCSGATGSFRRSSRGYGRGGLGDREWRL